MSLPTSSSRYRTKLLLQRLKMPQQPHQLAQKVVVRLAMLHTRWQPLQISS